jgi:formylglycine-generating enzyme required for sulfatase activity
MDRRSVLLGGVGLALGVASSVSGQQTTQKRFALILANQTYEKNPLPNIDNDASLMAKTLTGLGFTVTTLMNGTRSSMRTKLKELKDNLAANPGGISFVYYSGHGVQVDGENYLVPVNNGALTSEADVKEDCLSLSYVLEMSKGTQAKAYITVLDACRDNPFLGQKGDGNKGLAVVGRVLDASTLVAFAASPGETASATLGGANSIYTAELVKQLQTPNLSLQEVFQTTRSAVRTKSSNKQRPREDNGLEEQIYLNGRGSVTEREPTEKPTGNIPTSIRLELTGVPAGAKVTVDGAPLKGNVYDGDTVDKVKSLEVAVLADGFKPYLSVVNVARGASIVHTVMLEVRPKRVLTDFPALKAYIDTMQQIPAGTFKMGGREDANEQPIHDVTLSAFHMGRNVVTVAMWREYCAVAGRNMPMNAAQLKDNLPITWITWNEAFDFTKWASDITSTTVLLPSEAQWEYAARGGLSEKAYPWGNDFDVNKLHCSKDKTGDAKYFAFVDRTDRIFRNGYGLDDMVGNVYQMCRDHYAEDWYRKKESRLLNPVNLDYSPTTEFIDKNKVVKLRGRVIRGGAWHQTFRDDFRCSERGFFQENQSGGSSVGFRLVVTT